MPPTALPTLLALLKTSAGWLATKGVANARRESEWIFAHALQLTRLELYTQFDRPLGADEVDRLRALVSRRGRREPLAYLLGDQEFHGLTLAVGPGVLVPRPETEELVDHALADLPAGGLALDVGTGSGAIAAVLAARRPDARVFAVDRSEGALAIARRNLGRPVLVHGDLAGAFAGGLDLVVANLPYIADAERPLCDPELAHEPAVALFAGDGGMALINRLVADAGRLLAVGGVLWLEHGFTQAPRIAALAARHGLVAATRRDRSGHDRCSRLVRG